MTDKVIKGAKDLDNDLVIKLWNNPELSNEEVVNTLETSWENLRTKVTVNKSVAQELTVFRKGGVGEKAKWGVIEGAEDAIAERKAQESAEAAPEEATSEATAPAAAPQVADDQEAADTTKVSRSTAISTEVEDDAAFSFTAVILDEEYHFSGGNKAEAFEAARQTLIDLKFSKVVVKDAASGTIIDVGEITNGQQVVITKQLVAAV